MSKIINGGLDQYSAGPFEQQQFGTAGVERVKSRRPVRVRPGTAAGYAIGCLAPSPPRARPHNQLYYNCGADIRALRDHREGTMHKSGCDVA